MKRRAVWLSTIFLSAFTLLGCGATERSESPSLEAPSESKAPADASFQEYKEVWSIEVRGREVNAKKVGYLVKSFTQEEPEGRYFVRDLIWDIRGFLFPEGKAFAFEPRSGVTTPRDLGNTGFESGVKKILKVPGEVQFRLPTRPASPASPAPQG